MIWFLLFGLLGYCIYKISKHYWYRSLLKKIARYHNVRYRNLPLPEKKELKILVNTILDSGISLDEDTNKIVTPLYQEMELEAMYAQEGMRLKTSKNRQKPN